jgi:vanillate/4-hydroxybenzoate decarboxylase subunit D
VRSDQPDPEPAPIKEVVAGSCPDCGAEELRQYPVLSAGGWFVVVKCQRCLFSVSRTPWHRLGWVRLQEDAEGAI